MTSDLAAQVDPYGNDAGDEHRMTWCETCTDTHYPDEHNPITLTAPELATLRAAVQLTTVWDECMRVLKPGGHVLAFAGSRTVDLMALSIRLAGFDIRDSIAWLYGSGFPKSLDVAKAIDKAARGVPQGGADPTSAHHGQYRTSTTEGERWTGDKGQSYGAGGSRFLTSTASEKKAPQSSVDHAGGSQAATPDATALSEAAQPWEGWGTALKPAFEPIVVARKPLVGTVASNVLAHGTGALNIDANRVEGTVEGPGSTPRSSVGGRRGSMAGAMDRTDYDSSKGRWPANVVLDDSQAAELDRQAPDTGGSRPASGPSLTGATGASAAYGARNGPELYAVTDGAYDNTIEASATGFDFIRDYDRSNR